MSRAEIMSLAGAELFETLGPFPYCSLIEAVIVLRRWFAVLLFADFINRNVW